MVSILSAVWHPSFRRDQDILNAYNKIDDVVLADIQEIRDDVEKEFDVWYEASETLAEIVGSSENVPCVQCCRHSPNEWG